MALEKVMRHGDWERNRPIPKADAGGMSQSPFVSSSALVPHESGPHSPLCGPSRTAQRTVRTTELPTPDEMGWAFSGRKRPRHPENAPLPQKRFSRPPLRRRDQLRVGRAQAHRDAPVRAAPGSIGAQTLFDGQDCLVRHPHRLGKAVGPHLQRLTPFLDLHPDALVERAYVIINSRRQATGADGPQTPPFSLRPPSSPMEPFEAPRMQKSPGPEQAFFQAGGLELDAIALPWVEQKSFA